MGDSKAGAVMTAPSRVIWGENPFDVGVADDYLTEPRHDQPLWNESMYFAVWSPEAGVGAWLHLGVVPEEKTMWWAQTMALLPDGLVLASRSFGRARDLSGPRAGNLEVCCVEPQSRWRLTFDGAGALSSTAQLGRELVGADVAAPFAFDIALESVSPVSDIHEIFGDALAWETGGMHQEQGFRATGELRALGRRWTIDGVAVRDHGRGERHFRNYGGHAAVYAVWPQSQRAVQLFLMWPRQDASAVSASAGLIMEPGRTEICGHVSMSGLKVYGGGPRDLALSMIRPDGSRLDLRGEILHGVTTSYVEPNHSLIGAAVTSRWGEAVVCDQTIARWHWPDGEVGYGHVDRGVRPSVMPLSSVPLPPGSPLRIGD